MGAKSSNANTIKNWNALNRRGQRREGTENCQFKYEYKVNSEKNSAGRTLQEAPERLGFPFPSR